MKYLAGLLPNDAEEEWRFDDCGFSVREAARGPSSRFKMKDGGVKIDGIGPTIGKMIRQHGIDAARPQIEFYRSLADLYLIVPIPSA